MANVRQTVLRSSVPVPSTVQSNPSSISQQRQLPGGGEGAMFAVGVAFGCVVGVVALLTECGQVTLGIVGGVVVEVGGGEEHPAAGDRDGACRAQRRTTHSIPGRAGNGCAGRFFPSRVGRGPSSLDGSALGLLYCRLLDVGVVACLI